MISLPSTSTFGKPCDDTPGSRGPGRGRSCGPRHCARRAAGTAAEGLADGALVLTGRDLLVFYLRIHVICHATDLLIDSVVTKLFSDIE